MKKIREKVWTGHTLRGMISEFPMEISVHNKGRETATLLVPSYLKKKSFAVEARLKNLRFPSADTRGPPTFASRPPLLGPGI